MASRKSQWKHQHFINQNGKCIYCGCQMTLKLENGKQPPNYATLEHIHPRSLGGVDEIENTAASCHKCNSIKSDLPHELFMQLRQHPDFQLMLKSVRRANNQLTPETVEDYEVRNAISRVPYSDVLFALGGNNDCLITDQILEKHFWYTIEKTIANIKARWFIRLWRPATILAAFGCVF